MRLITKHAATGKEEHMADFISEMPNEVICHIISFLPVADAFSINLLSRRFRCSQVPISNLYFNKETIFGEKHDHLNMRNLRSDFVGKVSSFLKLFRSTHLNTFVVEFGLNHEYARVIDDWIRLAISMEVESVELDFYFSCCQADRQYLYKFPFSILPKPKSLTRLKHLKLSNCLLDLDHSPLSFNCLMTIELKMLTFDQTSLGRLLSFCSELESLTIDRCRGLDHLIVCSGGLKTLRILYCLETTSITLNSAMLQSFEFRSRNLKRVTYVVVPALQRVHLRFFNPYRAEKFYAPLRKSCHKLQSLSLSWVTRNNVPANLPEFMFVKQLEFFLAKYREFDLLSITNILNVCPLLRKVHVDLNSSVPGINDCITKKGDVKYADTAKYSNLEEIDVSGFHGTSDEMEFVKYLLKSAINLKHVTVIYSRWISDDYKWHSGRDDILEMMTRKKQVYFDSLHRDMISRDAKLIIC